MKTFLYIFQSIYIFFKNLIILIHFEKKSPEQIKHIQYKKLKETIDFAWENIPFYKSYWEGNNFKPTDFQSLEDIEKIPFIDKNTIRKEFNTMYPTNYPTKRLTLVTTGGTTGMPMKFYIDQYKAHAKELAYQIWGNYHFWKYRKGIDKVAILRGYKIEESKTSNQIYWKRSYRENGLIFSSFHISGDTYNVYLKKLREFKPKFIKAYPSSIIAFCSLMRTHNDFGISGLKGIICSSENIYPWQRKLVKQTLGVNIYSYYGHSEKAVAAFQATDERMLFHPLYGFTEFIDDSGLSTSENNRIAQVVVTSFDNDYFPFIRYKTFDYIEIANSQYGPYHKIANRIIGREQEFVYNKNNEKIIFTCSDEPIWGIPGIVAYQYIQNESGKMELHLQTKPDFNINNLQIIQQKAKKVFINIDINISIVNNIEKTPNGKFRYLIQNIPSKK